MDGRVYAAGELRIACTRGCAAGGSTGWLLHHADAILVFWSVCPCLVHAALSLSEYSRSDADACVGLCGDCEVTAFSLHFLDDFEQRTAPLCWTYLLTYLRGKFSGHGKLEPPCWRGEKRRCLTRHVPIP